MVGVPAAVLYEQSFERVLPLMPERRVTHVVRETDRVRKGAVETQAAGNGAPDLRRLHRVHEPRAVEVALGDNQHLRLVLKPPKVLAVDDPVAVTLKGGTRIGDRVAPVRTVGPGRLVRCPHVAERIAVAEIRVGRHATDCRTQRAGRQQRY